MILPLNPGESGVVMPHGGTMMHEKGPELASAKACM
jgi:hypothetical protein